MNFIFKEEIDIKAIKYIKEVAKFKGILNYGVKAHDYLISTERYGSDSNNTEWHEPKRMAWNAELMESIRGYEGSYIEVRISDKGLKVLDQYNKEKKDAKGKKI